MNGLFVNAGVFSPAPVGQNTEEIFDIQIGINFKGAVLPLRNFYPLLMMVILLLTFRL